MADETVPDPATILQQMQDMSTSGGGVLDTLKKIYDALSNFKGNGGVGTVVKGLEDAKDVAADFFSAISDGNVAVQKLALNAVLMVPFVQNTLNAAAAFDKFGDSASKSAIQVDTAFNSVQKITNLFSKLPGGLGTTAKFLSESVGTYEKSAQGAQDYENSILSLASSSGDLGNVLDKTGRNLGGLSDLTASWREKIYGTSQATGLYIKDIDTLAAGLGKIPGALDMTVKGAGGADKEMNLLQAVTTVASGTFRSQGDVLKELNDVYLSFNKTGQDALELLSGISTTSQDLKLPFETVDSTVRDISQSFADMGDNTEGALRVFQRFGPALQQAGVAPEQIKKTVESVAAGIRAMDIGQKAFLSKQGGGQGGLAGAYKIEGLIQQGKLDEVQKMAETALKRQFGGRVLNLQDAQQSEGNAAQFTKQVAFLKSGAFGGMAKTDADAYRLLDAFKKGTGSTVDFRAPAKSLEDTMNLGNTALLRNRDEMVNLGNKIELNARVAAENTLELRRRTTGVVGGKAGVAIDKFTTEAAGIGLTSNKLPGFTKSEAQNRDLKETKNILGDVGSIGSRLESAFVNSYKDARKTINDAKANEESRKNETLGLATPTGTGQLSGRPVLASHILAPHNPKDAAHPTVQAAQHRGQDSTIVVKLECPTCHKAHLEKIIQNKLDNNENSASTRTQLGYVPEF